MARITKPDQTSPATADRLFAAVKQRAGDWRRDHLGASLIGHECDRFLWLTFRWALDPAHDGQRLRLFARGQREEASIVEDLRAAGFTVHDRDPDTGDQFSISWGHFGGHLDAGVIGLVEAPDELHIGEFKTHNAKSFEKLTEKGVKAAKPEHWAQCQVYMHGKKLQHALYIGVCKNDDSIYCERITYDPVAARALRDRGVALTLLAEPPAKRIDKDYPPCVYTSADGTRWPCGFYELCHGSAMPARSCRTCIDAEPKKDGTFWCRFHEETLSPADQRAACEAHVTIPGLVNGQVASVDVEARRIVFAFADGRTVEG